jgi:hypothetical protein
VRNENPKKKFMKKVTKSSKRSKNHLMIPLKKMKTRLMKESLKKMFMMRITKNMK